MMKKSEMVDSFTIKSPIYVELGKKKKKKYYLNLNLLRNQVNHLNNNIKKEYKRIIEPLIPPNIYYEHFTIDYELFLPNKLKRDISNVLAIVDKNFTDAFVELRHAPDDNYEFLQEVSYKYGGYDPDKKGYVLITVKEAKEYESV
jgi:CRISPR/Cas system endoribonuclease Cas6 (RAMP superfamily)